MVGVQRDIDRLAARLQCRDHRRIDLPGIDDRNTRMETHDLHMRDPGKRLHDLVEPARGKHQRIAAGEDDLPDLLMTAYIIESGLHRRGIECAEALRPHHFAPEAEAAIDRADMHGLEQYTIGIAVNDAFDGAVGMIADRIGAFFRAIVSSAASGTNCRTIGSSGSVRSMSLLIAGVSAIA